MFSKLQHLAPLNNKCLIPQWVKHFKLVTHSPRERLISLTLTGGCSAPVKWSRPMVGSATSSATELLPHVSMFLLIAPLCSFSLDQTSMSVNKTNHVLEAAQPHRERDEPWVKYKKDARLTLVLMCCGEETCKRNVGMYTMNKSYRSNSYFKQVPYFPPSKSHRFA